MNRVAHDVEAVGRRLVFSYEGQRIDAIEGESIAAALTAAGIVGLRGAQDGSRRGIYCGMGACQECLVTVDGKIGVRACMTPVTEGSKVTGQSENVKRREIPGQRQYTRVDAAPDLLVIGGGPAGLAATRHAAEAGLDTVLVDERPGLGGQFYKQLASAYRFANPKSEDSQSQNGRRLINRVRALKVNIIENALVWGAFAPVEICVLSGTTNYVFRPRRVILATGAYERGVPIPGWTLPGFMTTGACQTLLRAYRVTPGQRVLVAGNGPLNLQVAVELARVGIEVIGIVEAAQRPGFRHVGTLLRALASAPGLMQDGFSYLWRARRFGIPFYYRHALIRALGDERVSGAVIARIDENGIPITGTERHMAVDAICVGSGFMPQNELARALGCCHRFDTRFGHLAVVRDEDGRTSVPEIYVAGDCGGLGGARVAFAQGAIAAFAAAASLGMTLTTAQQTTLTGIRKDLKRARRFQTALWTLYNAPVPTDNVAESDTLICRCENVDHARIKAAIADGIHTLGALKRETRAGMGRCQGRYCAPVLAQMISAVTGSPVDDMAFFAPRPPVKPVPIGAIAQTLSSGIETRMHNS